MSLDGSEIANAEAMLAARLRALASESPGARLPSERALADRLAVPRRALRRALAALEAEGALWRRQGKGTFAGPAPASAAPAVAARTNPLEVMEARLCVEPGLARLAALRASREDIRAMRSLLAALEEAAEPEEKERRDGALHRAIAQAAGNGMLTGVFDMIERARLDPDWRRLRELARSGPRLATYAAQHRDIVDAIEARDPAAAEQAMRRHLAALSLALQPFAMGLVDG